MLHVTVRVVLVIISAMVIPAHVIQVVMDIMRDVTHTVGQSAHAMVVVICTKHVLAIPQTIQLVAKQVAIMPLMD